MATDNRNAFEYINKFQKENYDRITILRKKGEKDKLKEICKEKNMSVNEFINDCIDRRLKQLKVEL